MGLIRSITQSMRNNKLSRKLSTSKPRQRYEDSNDLIKIPSNAGSLTGEPARPPSPTIVQQKETESIFPAESPSRRAPLSPADLNLQSLFDNAETLDPNSRAMKALSMPPEYPVYRLDTSKSPTGSPKKRLQDPIETKENWGVRERAGRRMSMMSRSDKRKSDMSGINENPRSKIRRSMNGVSEFLRRNSSAQNPRSCSSLKTLRSGSSQKWLESDSDNDSLGKEQTELKWLEVNGLSDPYTGRAFEFWGNQVMARRYC
ncbi:hypothetical protein N7468_007971 [Penicillium chermesinum]|uniref:Uncharacterized protein n=1 Tax=Penicillium chermesinum TaxID=63820 RepID=A0A9W9TI79_9EURO|nr:uncharacterized protein N7468_007971 [Penicillium chermesinum]KAJ5223429.1 hypothetical protein N7468_007971 [Penicillium chermesinum]KAJ6155735.1 hypothetical protein N7470_006301 [Penicillium chermesinum]